MDEFLPSGRVSGWTDSFNNGLPFGEAYPWFGHLWSAALHLVTGGLVSQRASYAWGLLAVWLIGALGVWLVAALVAEEVTDDPQHKRSLAAWAGCIGALTWLLDPGGSRQGGWNYLMFHGVWPQLLSASLWVLALPLTWRALTKPSPRRLATAALCLGGSVLAHPFGLLTLVCSAAIWLAVLLLMPRAKQLPSGRLGWWAVVHTLAALIGFGWLASFLAGADSLGRSPVPWESISVLARDLVRGNLMPGHAAWSGPLAVVGLVLALRRGGVIAWLSTGLVLGMLVLASQEALTVLQLDLVAPAFKNLQFPRYSIAIKPLLFAMVGVGGAVAARSLRGMFGAVVRRSLPQRLGIGLILAPLLIGLLVGPGRIVERPVGAVESLRASGAEQDEAALRQALVAEREQLGDTPMSVAFLRDKMGGGMYPAMSVAAAGARLVLDGHVATINMQHRIGPRSVRGLVGLGVTHVIHDRPLDEETDLELIASLSLIGTYGPYNLHRLRASPQLPPADAVSWTGDATVEIVEAETGHWVVSIADVAKPTRVRFPFAPHPKWTATLDGEDVEIAAVKRWGGAATGTAVDVTHAGELVLHYTDTSRETTAQWLALIAGLVSLGGLAVGRRLPEPAWTPSPVMTRVTAIAVVLALVAGVVWVRGRQQQQLATTWEDLADEIGRTSKLDLTFVADAVVDHDVSIERTPDTACVGLLSKNAHDLCSEAEHAPHMSFLYASPYLYRCVEFTVPAHGTAKIGLGSIGADDWAMAIVRRRDRTGKGKKFKFRTANVNKWRVLGNATRTLAAPGHAVGGAPILELQNESRRNEPVCVAVGVASP